MDEEKSKISTEETLLSLNYVSDKNNLLKVNRYNEKMTNKIKNMLKVIDQIENNIATRIGEQIELTDDLNKKSQENITLLTKICKFCYDE